MKFKSLLTSALAVTLLAGCEAAIAGSDFDTPDIPIGAGLHAESAQPSAGSVRFGKSGAANELPSSDYHPQAPAPASLVLTDANGMPVVIPADPVGPPDLTAQVALVLGKLAVSHPWIALLLAFMGSMRFWINPVTFALHRYLESTPTKADDEFVERVERSVWWTGFLFLVDWLASIKVPARQERPSTSSGSRLSLILGLLLPAALLVGCAPLAPGAEGFVVRSEQTISAAFTTTDSFLTWEEANRESLPEQVTAIADTLREDFPPAHDAALASIVAYKKDRTAFAKDAVSKWLVTLQKMSDQAAKARAEIAKP